MFLIIFYLFRCINFFLQGQPFIFFRKSYFRLIEISKENNNLLMTIQDNGKGFDLKPLHDPGNKSFGLGIRNMHERATLIGARFSIDSETGKGTKLYLELPLKND